MCTLTLQFEQIRALGINIRSLGLQHLVQTLALKTAACHRKVHERHARAQVRRKLNLRSKLTQLIKSILQKMSSYVRYRE